MAQLRERAVQRRVRLIVLALTVGLLVILAGSPLLHERIVALLTQGNGALTDGQLRIGGDTRVYHLYSPPSPSIQRPRPLIVVLHGAPGTGEGMMESTRMDLLADRVNALVVYPDGINETWNAGLCCDPARRWHVPDVEFLSRLVAHLESTQAVDPARVFVTGFSNGGVMTYVVACHLAAVVAAVAVVSGDMDPASCHPARPVAVLAIHGTADHSLAFNGGTPPGFAPIPTVIDRWRALDGCNGPIQVSGQGVVQTRASLACRSGTAVVLMTIEGGGHAWPGSWSWDFPRRLRPTVSGPFNTADVAWTFFAAHPQHT
jgi:polyhydroxybutyrate depolymerase